MHRFIARIAILAAAVLLALPAARAEAVTKAQLQAQINTLKQKVKNLRTDVNTLYFCQGWYVPVSQYSGYAATAGGDTTAFDYDPDVAGAHFQMVVLADECRDPGTRSTAGLGFRLAADARVGTLAAKVR